MMSTATAGDDAGRKPPLAARSTLRTDSLALGVSMMLGLSVLQRIVGMVRSILFCRLMTDEELGTWSLAFSFLLLAAPLAVLGLPGSFGRYAERYRQRGQLAAFLRRTSLVIGLLALVGVGVVCLAREPVSWLVFNDTAHADLMLTLALSLAAVIAVNYVVDLLTSLRQVRAVSLLQFAHSMVFAAVGLTLLSITHMGAQAVVVAYAAGSLAGIAIAVPSLLRVWRSTSEESAGDAPSQRDLWSHLAPFAVWIWVINLLTNLFEMADRYMIVHFARGTTEQVHALVGQYHSSRVLPSLMMAAAGMVAAVALPYLSHDWEAGRRGDVARRLNTLMTLVGLAFFAGGAVVLVAAPLVFDWVLSGRYNDGLAVLPWTLAYAGWFSISLVAQSYLWCAERARLANAALLLGLIANVALNLALLPWLGLSGAVLATAAANALALAMVLYFGRSAGMRWRRGALLVCLLPVLLGLGVWVTLLGAAAVALAALRTEWIFTDDQRQEVWQQGRDLWARFRPA
ncbi:MAG: lipopolysaccharide biosynthesis protein [Pirellulaceae bacterium]